MYCSIFNCTQGFFNEGVDQILDHDSESSLNNLNLVLIGATALVGLKILFQSCQRKWTKSPKELLGKVVLNNFKGIRSKYNQQIIQHRDHFQISMLKKFTQFTSAELFPITVIPERGHSVNHLLKIINLYSRITNSRLENKQFTGTIYSNALIKNENKSISFQNRRYSNHDIKETESKTLSIYDDALIPEDCTNSEYFSKMNDKLEFIFTEAFRKSYLWNSLHSDVFPIGSYIDYQIVKMVGGMFNGISKEVMGYVTSGGTESLMLAIRAYRNWGMEEKGHRIGEGVVLAGDSVHTSILKAGETYNINVELVETDALGKINLKDLRNKLIKYGNKVIAIVGSAPSYPFGVVDPIHKMAEMAKQCHCGFHVDCCLGAFVINNLSHHKTDYLALQGVTSLSADIHKNGLAPIGSSVLITKKISYKSKNENLAYYSIYSLLNPSSGVNGTPKDAGSQSCVSSFNTLLAMLAIGKKGYSKMAEAIHQTTIELAKVITKFEKKLKLIVDPEVNIVAFQIDDILGLSHGATYAFAHEMAKRGFVLNTFKGGRLHFCVTLRFVCDKNAIKNFEEAAIESLKVVIDLDKKLKFAGERLPGDAGMYCALETTMNPDPKTLSISEYVENVLFGKLLAKDIIKAFFLAQMDPFLKT